MLKSPWQTFVHHGTHNYIGELRRWITSSRLRKIIRSFWGLGLQVYGWPGWGVQDVHEVFCSWQQRQGPPLGRMEGHRGGQETAQKDDGAGKHCYQRLDHKHLKMSTWNLQSRGHNVSFNLTILLDISDEKLELLTYEASHEGMMDSWRERFSPEEHKQIDNILLVNCLC